ncbi:MAG: sigma-70 family RNA polymerase sigma factor [Planctomycetes bacterium]|nr:sigma-70 family RNA polymerase sigma factor [Planctomycetota bacterium]
MNGNPKTKVVDIEWLVKASQRGDRGSFDELVGLYQRRAIQVAVRILGDANEAAEAVQNGFVKVYLSIDKLKEPKRFEAWFFRIITNTAISQRRVAKGRADIIKIVGDSQSKKVFTPEQKEAGKELKEAIQQAMLKLSKKQAQAIALTGIEDLPRDEVAQIMDCSTEVVKWHVFKARQKLKVLLKEYLQ